MLFALCPECHPGRPIVMEVRTDSLGQKGVFIGFLNQSDIPPEILPVSDLGSLDRFVSADALAKYEKLEFGE